MSNIFFEFVKKIYSFRRLQWLVFTTVTICIVYLTSEEIWTIMDGLPNPEISLNGMILYCLFFSILSLVVYIYSNMKYNYNIILTTIISSLSLLIDLMVIMSTEFFILKMINVLPAQNINILGTLLIGALPSVLGVITISSITSEYLEEKVNRLKNEIKEIKKSVEKIDANWNEYLNNREEFQKLRKKLNEIIKEKEEEQ